MAARWAAASVEAASIAGSTVDSITDSAVLAVSTDLALVFTAAIGRIGAVTVTAGIPGGITDILIILLPTTLRAITLTIRLRM